MEGKGWIWGLLVLVVIIGGGWWYATSKGGAQSGGESVKIGFMGPLSGDAAQYGEAMRNTVMLAVEEVNAAGGINGQPLEVVYEDDKCNGKEGTSAAQKLISSDGVKVIMGSFCSGATIPSVPIAAAAKVLLFSPGASSPALTGISPYFFRSYPNDNGQGKALADLAIAKNWKSVAVLQEETEYATGLNKAFVDSFTPQGGKASLDKFQTTTTDFRTVLTKLKNAKPDVLFLVTQSTESVSRILKNLQDLGWKPQLFLSDAGFGDTATLAKYSSVTGGAIGAEFIPPETDAKFMHLADAYKAKYNQDLPFHGYASSYYDAVYLLKEGIESQGYDAEKLATWSRTINNWQGASGSVTIGQDGDRVGGFKAEVIKGGKKELVQ